MPDPSALSPGRVADLIRQYLRDHPRAADTAEGIQRWWVVPTFGEVSLGSVERALIQLEKDGVVRKVDSSAATAMYERGPALVNGRTAGDRDGQ